VAVSPASAGVAASDSIIAAAASKTDRFLDNVVLLFE